MMAMGTETTSMTRMRARGRKDLATMTREQEEIFAGSQSRTRTCNLAINSRLLCQLSYLGMHPRARKL